MVTIEVITTIAGGLPVLAIADFCEGGDFCGIDFQWKNKRSLPAKLQGRITGADIDRAIGTMYETGQIPA